VEATLRVHDEQGITRTSVRDVAERAGVSPATVLNHFPRMGDLIRACGQLSDELLPMPTAAVLVGARDPVEAVRLAARALFGWWEALGASWDHLQVDRRTLLEVDAWLRDVDRRHRSLVREAVGPGVDSDRIAVVAALTSRGAWIALRDSGLDLDRAAAQVARTFMAPERNLH
jgi:AcrR family transcriptional regulator